MTSPRAKQLSSKIEVYHVKSLSFFGIETFEKLSRSYWTRRAWLCQNVNKRVIMRPGRHTKPVNVAILGFLTDYKRRHGVWPNLQKECLLMLFSPLFQKVVHLKSYTKLNFWWRVIGIYVKDNKVRRQLKTNICIFFTIPSPYCGTYEKGNARRSNLKISVGA